MANTNGRTTAEELLRAQQHTQAEATKVERAAERIDSDPEEALAAIAPDAKATDGSPITVQDMFSLFGQLMAAQRELALRQATQQEQLIAVLTNQQKLQERSKAHTQEELEQAATQQRATLKSWDEEQKIPVFLQPELHEQKIAQVMNEYPPRLFRINGLEFAVPVNEVVLVPASVAAVVQHTQQYRVKQRITRPVQDTETIARPKHVQFLAGQQEISAGAAGVAGEGRLIPSPVAAGPASAQPLDYRYDAFGQ